MSFHHQKWVDAHSPVRGPARELLRIMAGMVNDEHGNLMWCRNDVLVKKLGRSERTVQRLTQRLELAGAIRKVQQFTDDGRQYNNSYVILTPGLSLLGEAPKGGRVTKVTPSPQDAAGEGVISVTLPLSGMSPSPCQKRHPPREITKRNNQEKSNGTTTAAAGREAVQKALLLIGEAQRQPLASQDLVGALTCEIELLRVIAGSGSFEYWCREVTSRKLRDRKRDYGQARTQLNGISEVFARRSLLDARVEVRRFATIQDWSDDDVAERRRQIVEGSPMRRTG